MKQASLRRNYNLPGLDFFLSSFIGTVLYTGNPSDEPYLILTGGGEK